jgi:hypothetical protein
MGYLVQRKNRFYAVGHANPAFTMTTYQHVPPGMGADAANRFA